MASKTPARRVRGTSRCRVCGELGHFTKTCERWTGKRFGRLTVLRGAPMAVSPSGTKKQCVRVLCDCGAEKVMPLEHLTRKKGVRSCGCIRLGLVLPQQQPSTEPAKIVQCQEPPPERVTVFGAEMSLGELAALARKRPDQLWRLMRFQKMSAEEAAFGKRGAADRREELALDAIRCDARKALSEWTARFEEIRGDAEFAAVFEAIASVVVTTLKAA